MALSRRTGQRFQASIWPGFVDAMTALLLVLMFVLTIFMVVQFMLRETITGQETELDQLSAQVAELADIEHIMHHETHVTDRSAIGGHVRSLRKGVWGRVIEWVQSAGKPVHSLAPAVNQRTLTPPDSMRNASCPSVG